MSRQISEERKTAYYLGMALMVFGGLLFFSVFIGGAMNFGNFNNFEARTRSSAFRAFGGILAGIFAPFPVSRRDRQGRQDVPVAHLSAMRAGI